jgi:hypothetical protein
MVVFFIFKIMLLIVQSFKIYLKIIQLIITGEFFILIVYFIIVLLIIITLNIILQIFLEEFFMAFNQIIRFIIIHLKIILLTKEEQYILL